MGPKPVFAAALATALVAALAPPAFAEEAFNVSADDPGLEWAPCPEFMPEGCAISVLNGDPAAPDADLFFRVPGGAEIPLHRHSSAERMVLVSGELEVHYEGQEPVTLGTGDYAYGPPGLPHSGVCREGPPCVLFIAFVGPVDALEGAADGG